MRGHDTNVTTNGQAAADGREPSLLDLLRFGSQTLRSGRVAHFKPYRRLRVTDRFDPGIRRDRTPYPNTDGAA